MQVTALSCPSCGGAIARERMRCAYCGTVAVLSSDQSRAVAVGVACPRCAAINAESEKHCGGCGALLVIECPKPKCLTENSVWRQHCKKCGSDIRRLWCEHIEARKAAISERLARIKAEMERIAAELPASALRERIMKAGIAAAGGIIALLILCFAGKRGMPLVLMAVAAALIWAASYRSTEKHMLSETADEYARETEKLRRELKTQKKRLEDIETYPSCQCG